MAQRRKKSNSFKKEKIAQTWHRKESLNKFVNFVKAIYGHEVFSKMPPVILSKAFMNRILAFKVIASAECSVPSSILNKARLMVSSTTKSRNISVFPGELEVSIADFFTVFLTVSMILPGLVEEDPVASKSIKLSSDELNTIIGNALEKANNEIYNILLAFGLSESDIGKTQYYLNHNISHCASLESGISNIIIISSYKIESSSITIDNISRPAIRLGYTFPNYGIDWISIAPSVLKIAGNSSDTPHDVYIQSHALQRLSERIDCFPVGTVHYNLFLSFKFPAVFFDSNGDILIEFRFFNARAGYFRVDIVDGKIVIRTFLFVTNNGTHEGQKLENITGLQKLDKKYLAIDKLSTFMTSDIGQNENVKKIFIDAGCQCLLDLYEQSHSIATNTPKHFNSELLLKYIDFDKKHFPEPLQKKASFPINL